MFSELMLYLSYLLQKDTRQKFRQLVYLVLVKRMQRDFIFSLKASKMISFIFVNLGFSLRHPSLHSSLNLGKISTIYVNSKVCMNVFHVAYTT